MMFAIKNIMCLFFISNIRNMFDMANIAVRNTLALGANIKTRRRALGWSQQQLADRIGTQRQWVIRLEAGSEGVELGLVLKTITALGLSITLGSEVIDALRALAQQLPDHITAARDNALQQRLSAVPINEASSLMLKHVDERRRFLG
jgi:transcriptional regulator with XRE-family HTH domain